MRLNWAVAAESLVFQEAKARKLARRAKFRDSILLNWAVAPEILLCREAMEHKLAYRAKFRGLIRLNSVAVQLHHQLPVRIRVALHPRARPSQLQLDP